MITTVLRVAFLNFMRDRVALVLTFVLPIMFFTIFAFIFGGMGDGKTERFKLAIADEDHTESSRRFIAALQSDESLEVQLAPADVAHKPYDRDAVRALVTRGKLSAGLVVPKGFSTTFGLFGAPGDDAVPCELLIDKSDPTAGPMIAGLMQRAAMTAAPDLMIERGVEMLDKFVTPFSAEQRESINSFLPKFRNLIGAGAQTTSQPGAATTATAPRLTATEGSAPAKKPDPATASFSGPVAVKIVDVIGERDKTPMIAYYAAGTAVLFLLFSASGAGGALLEEEETGVLGRLLSSRLTMTQLLLGKWLLIVGIGVVQVFLMFAWGALLFKVPLFDTYHLSGFAIMTLVTAGAAASFGLVIAAACRSRAQLGGVSTIVILAMSAVGGSMVPRFIMPEGMKTAGYFTFNAWALDGYQKVFWRHVPLVELWPQVLVLTSLTLVFLVAARLLARRWETAT